MGDFADDFFECIVALGAKKADAKVPKGYALNCEYDFSTGLAISMCKRCSRS